VTAAAYITIVERRQKPMTFPVSDSEEDDRIKAFLAAIDAFTAGADS
jgi:hypothetical protein